MVTDERIIRHLNVTSGSSLITSLLTKIGPLEIHEAWLYFVLAQVYEHYKILQI
jgi:hypothetical protein